MDNGLTLLLILGLLWFWWDSRGVAEIAIKAARRKCEQTELTFLNDTVGRKKLRLQRNRQGRLQLQRTYFFEFASDMAERYKGEIVMLGQQVTQIKMEVHRVK